MYANVKQLLQTAERTCCMQVRNLALRNQHIQPIFRAIQLQSSLRELDFQGNQLGDEGISRLLPVLSTLPNLGVLDISCNGLTDASLGGLASALEECSSTNNRILQLLEKLALSFNYLGNDCCLSLARCVNKLPRLRHLFIASCGLTVQFFEHHRAALAEAFQARTSLQRLDVSLNKFGATGLELLLRCVNLNRLSSVNLSNIVDQTNHRQMMKHLCHHTSDDSCCLEEIYLECCHLSSETVPDICRFMQQCKSLKRLSLSGNVELSAADLGEILSSGCCAVSRRSPVDVEFVACGLVSPLNVSFLDALNDLLQREQDGRVVLLNSIRMSIAKLCKLDGDSLREIWTGYWHERGVVNVTGDVISMSVADVISR